MPGTANSPHVADGFPVVKMCVSVRPYVRKAMMETMASFFKDTELRG